MPDDDLDRLPSRIAGTLYGIVLGILVGSPLGFVFGIRGWTLVLFVVGAVFFMAFTVWRLNTGAPEGMANALLRFVFPSGYTTPYEPTYSVEQSLAAAGGPAGAPGAPGGGRRPPPP